MKFIYSYFVNATFCFFFNFKLHAKDANIHKTHTHLCRYTHTNPILLPCAHIQKTKPRDSSSIGSSPTIAYTIESLQKYVKNILFVSKRGELSIYKLVRLLGFL